MTGPIRDTTGERIQDVFVESPTRVNKTAVEVFVGNYAQISGGGGSGLNQLTEKTSVTITSLTVNTWVTVPITTINVISDLSAFDQSDYEEVVLAWRVISSGSQVQIKSKIENTFTIHVEGYLV